MEELVKLVSKKTGLSAEKSRLAVELVIAFLKKKLPPTIGSQIDTILSLSGAAEGLMGGLGALKKKK